MKKLWLLAFMFAALPLWLILPARAAADCPGGFDGIPPRLAVIAASGRAVIGVQPPRVHPPYLVRGNKLVVLGVQAGRACIIFTAPSKAAHVTAGWVDASKITLMPEPADWSGDWRSGSEREIRIDPVGAGAYKVDGNATFGASDPGRVARGAIDTGEISGIIHPARGQATLDTSCHVQFWSLGSYLWVVDDTQCGGMNVSFTGFYRRPGK
jgi:hypothetical protein